MAEEAVSCIAGNSYLPQNRQERKRKTTDIACLVIYGLFFIVWIGIAIYAYNNSSVSPITTVKAVLECLWRGLFVKPKVFFFTWFCIILIAFYFTMLLWCTKFTVYLTMFLEFFVTTLLLIAIGLKTYSVIVLPILLFFFIIFWIEIQILRKADVHMVCNIITNACKALITFPSSLLIALLCLFTTGLLLLFVATVVYCLSNPNPIITFVPDNSYSSSLHSLGSSNIYQYFNGEHQITMKKIEKFVSNMGLIVVFMILSYWILLVNCLSMLSVLHGMFTSWCRMKNKNTIPRFTIVRHLFNAYRYHIGSFAFMSLPFVPIIQLIRTICTSIHMVKMTFKESPYNIFCFLVIILNVFTNTCVVCSSYGKCYYSSMKVAFKVLVQNPMKFTATRLVITGMLFFGLILIPGIVIGLAVLQHAIWNTFDYGIYLAAICSVAIIVTSGILFIFSAAVDSVLFCHLEELLKNRKVADNGPENNYI